MVNRGALRSPLFGDEIGCRLILGTLRDALARHPVELLAWCLMPNHWHLLVRPGTAEALPPFMRWLTLTHSRRWQALHGREGQGTLYQGRYRSTAVKTDGQLLTVVRYIERNPVRAGLVASAADWPWSSVRERSMCTRDLLAPLPVPLLGDWLTHLDAPQTAAEVEAVRTALRGGRPGRRPTRAAAEPSTLR